MAHIAYKRQPSELMMSWGVSRPLGPVGLRVSRMGVLGGA
jgi:hypothetical protein